MIDVICCYVGGKSEYPTYSAIADFTEGVTVCYDSKVTSYERLLEYYFSAHNPYSPCSAKQQYNSGVWWHTDAQRLLVEEKVKALEAQSGRTVLSRREPLTRVYRAEEYHQNFYKKHGGGGL